MSKMMCRKRMTMQTPDAAIRARALEVSESFIVQAPAGSGKTELLTQRVLALLCVVDHPSEVVAITFTRKAAAEMRARIVERLADADAASAGHRAWTHHRHTGYDLRAQPDLIRVITFDALFRMLVNEAPLAVGIAPDTLTLEDATQPYRDAANAALSEPTIASDAQTLLTRLDGDLGLAIDLIAQLLARRDQWLALALDANGLDALTVREALAHTLKDVLQREDAVLRQGLTSQHFVQWLQVARTAWPNTGVPHAVPEQWPGDDVDALPEWKALIDLVLTQAQTPTVRSSTTINKRDGLPAEAIAEKKALGALRQTLTDTPALAAALGRIRSLPTLSGVEGELDTLSAMHSVLRWAAVQLQVEFAGANATDFLGIAAAVASALDHEDGQLALVVARSMRHVLIDEFQDTSVTQFRAIAGLTRAWERFGHGTETLFCVGDPMQSIYRFREAEVALFAQAQRTGIGPLRLTALTLRANFRSTPPLVEWVNATLGAAFAAQASAVPFAPAIAMQAASSVAQPVSVRAFESDADEQRAIVETVGAWNADPRFQSIGILVRARGHARALTAALAAAGVLSSASDIVSVASQAWVRDLSALAYALSQADDHLSWLALLRAPWCGLPLADLSAIAAHAALYRCSVWQAASQSAALTEEGAHRVHVWITQLAPCVAAVGQRALASIVEVAWHRLDAMACFAELDVSAWEMAIEALRTQERGGRLHDREAFSRALKAIAAPAANAPGKVQVMTLHKAKGLQFDAVVLPQLARKTRSDGKPLLRWHRFERGALAMPKPDAADRDAGLLYDWMGSLERELDGQERQRLLYVGVTRAKQALLLTATLASTADGDARPANPSALWATLAARTAWTWHPALRSEEAPPDAHTAVAPPLIRRAQMPLLLDQHLKADVALRGNALFNAPTLPTASTALGTLMHAWLSMHGNQGAWSPHAAMWADQEALLLGIAEPRQRAEMVASLANMVARVAACPHAAMIFAGHSQAYNELSLSVVEGTAVKVLRPDRVFRSGDNDVWIVDYKTSIPHDNESTDAFLVREAASYEASLRAYQRAVQASALSVGARSVRTALYFPKLGLLHEVSPGKAD
jgi:ATP-dependent helicase/nuclease subunit A